MFRMLSMPIPWLSTSGAVLAQIFVKENPQKVLERRDSMRTSVAGSAYFVMFEGMFSRILVRKSQFTTTKLFGHFISRRTEKPWFC